VVVRECACSSRAKLDPTDHAAKITPRTKLFAIGASGQFARHGLYDLALARRLTPRGRRAAGDRRRAYAPHFPIDVQALGRSLCSGYNLRAARGRAVFAGPGRLR